jgi:uncharacterized protein (DUF58 family)
MNASPPARLKLRARLWLALIPLLALLQLLFPNPVWVTLLAGLGGAILAGYLWAWSLRRSLSLEREMRYGWAHVGDRLEERFTLTNTGMIPAMWVEISDQSTLPDYHVGQVTAVSGATRNSWKTDQVCSQRGLFRLGPTRLRSGDPLGLFQVTLDLPGSTVLMITPPIVPLPTIEITPSGRAGEGRRPRPDPFEHSVGASDVRPYRPGDPLRWIHWPVSARHDSLYVRNFDSTPASAWWIFLDLDATVQAGSGWNSTLEHGLILAASLADRGLRSNHPVGLAAAGEKLIWLPAESSGQQRIQILRELALAKPGAASLARLLDSARRPLQRGATLIVITASLDRSWLEPLSHLTHSRSAPTVLLFDPNSYGASQETAAGVRAMQAGLTNLGATPYLIHRDLLDRPEAHPGHEGEWEWRVTGLGKAIARRKPSNLNWRKVGS